MNPKYTNWAKNQQNKVDAKETNEEISLASGNYHLDHGNEAKKMFDHILDEEKANRVDEAKKEAENWTDEKRDSFKAEVFAREGYDFESAPNLSLLRETVAEKKDILTLHCSTTGLKGKDSMSLWDVDKEFAQPTKDDVKEHLNDVPTNIAFSLFKFNQKTNQYELADLQNFLIKTPKAIIERCDEKLQADIKAGRRPYDVFENASIDKETINDIGIGWNLIVEEVDKYMEKISPNTVIASYQNEFVTNMLAHLNIYVDVPLDLCKVVNDYNLTQDDRLIKGRADLGNVTNSIREMHGIAKTELKSAPEKAEAMGLIVNEVLVREMIKENNPELYEQVSEYCNSKSSKDAKVNEHLSELLKSISQGMYQFDLSNAEYDEDEIPIDYSDEIAEFGNIIKTAPVSNTHGELYSDKQGDTMDVVIADNVQKVGEVNLPHVSEAFEKDAKAEAILTPAYMALVTKQVSLLQRDIKLREKDLELREREVSIREKQLEATTSLNLKEISSLLIRMEDTVNMIRQNVAENNLSNVIPLPEKEKFSKEVKTLEPAK